MLGMGKLRVDEAQFHPHQSKLASISELRVYYSILNEPPPLQ